MSSGQRAQYRVTGSSVCYDGAIVRIRVDTVVMPDGTPKAREVVEHAESAAVVAMDEHGRVLLIEQYRHPVRATITEIPAGLRDVDDLDLLVTAQRELREETGLTARRWDHLLDLLPSPGISTESAAVFLARELEQGERKPAPASEETDMTMRWVPLAEAVEQVRARRITDAMAVAGLLAVYAWPF